MTTLTTTAQTKKQTFVSIDLEQIRTANLIFVEHNYLKQNIIEYERLNQLNDSIINNLNSQNKNLNKMLEYERNVNNTIQKLHDQRIKQEIKTKRMYKIGFVVTLIGGGYLIFK